MNHDPDAEGCRGVGNDAGDIGQSGDGGRGGGRFSLYWNVDVITAIVGQADIYVSHQLSGPFCGFDVAEDVARDFAAKPGVLMVQIKPAVPREEVNPAQSREEGDKDARIEALFYAAAADRSVAPILKHYLDRLGLWKKYEDRFLDLFSRRASGPPRKDLP
jgi:hypothetical protein